MQASASISELSQENHNERQRFEVCLEGLQIRVQKLRSTDKFKNINGFWHSQDYQGYALVSMLDANPKNEELSEKLLGIQHRIWQQIQLPRQFYLMPKESFHQTIVNTLSGNRFKEHIENKGLKSVYPTIIKDALDLASKSKLGQPIQMNFAGLGIFGSAFGVLGTINKTEDWNAILQLRNELYSNANLNQHDIKRTRPFIAHITLGYIDGVLSEADRKKLVEIFNEINSSINFSDLVFNIDKTQLRSYDHLAEFVYKRNYPSYKFCGHAT
ncbi:MAG: hypothetical protein AAGH81_17680 [Bacteroidota bacterium]|nr:hypothetical protein [uncultured Allomuricauda sp.]